MFEIYKLKKAKAKLELESVNKRLNEINVKKEQELWEQMPLWQKNMERQIALDKLGLLDERKERSTKFAVIMSLITTIGIWTTFFYISYSLLFTYSVPANTHNLSSYNAITVSHNAINIPATSVLMLFVPTIIMTFVEFFYVFKRGRGIFLFK